VGESHPDFARGLNNLGLLYEAANRWKEAEQAFQQAVDIMAFAVGADDLDTKKSLGNLKRVLKRIAAGD
jgi:tetratricopeptide (TPR) repeat protein